MIPGLPTAEIFAGMVGSRAGRDCRVGLVMLLTVMAGSSAEGYVAMWVFPKIVVPQNG